jgi:hypothetical protein
MLGIGRASQYAGWWGGPPRVIFYAESALSYTNRQTPSYSLLCDTENLPYNTVASGEIDLTGYSSLTGFNNGKLTTINTFRPQWPDPIVSTTDFVGVNFFNELKQGGTTYFLNPTVGLTNPGNSVVYIQSPTAQQFITGLTPSVINNRWLTLVTSVSNSQSDYVNWTGTGTATSYVRVCLFDAETGELLYRGDQPANTSLPTVSSMPDTIPTSQTGDNNLFSGGFGSGTSETTFYRFRFSNHWFCAGTMFDPLGSAATADTSWRTTRPSAVIGTAVAWLNIQTAEFEYIVSPENYYVTASGMDLYSQADDRVVKDSGYGGSQWTTAYSDTIVTTDQG